MASLKWKEYESVGTPKSLVDVAGFGYGIRPSVTWRGPSLQKFVVWYATFEGVRICENGTKTEAKREANKHNAERMERIKQALVK